MLRVQLQNKTTSVETVDNVGTPQLRQFHMVNIDMWHHPKYYKELRKRNKTGVTATTKRDIGHSQELSFGFPPPVTSDQVISLCTATAASRRAPGSGLKQSNNAGTLISRLCNKRKGGNGPEAKFVGTPPF